MTKNDIIELVCKDNYYRNYCRKISNYDKLADDLYQHVILQFIQLKEDKIIHLYGQNLKGYLCRMFWLNWNSKLAPFWREYRFEFDDLTDKESISLSDDEEFSIEVANEVLKEEIEKSNSKGQYHWHVELFNLYVEQGNYRELSRKLDIPYPTVRYNVNKLIEKINERIANHSKRA